MKILLINNNPVVSRLTALSARKENIEIDEIQEVTELSSDSYDIVFVDADSYSKDVREIITQHIKVQKSVLFYSEGDEEDKSLFNLSILKPFLPSEVSAVIRSVEESSSKESQESVIEEEIFDILDDSKEPNRAELFSLNESTDDVKESKDTFDEKLEEAFPLKINTLDDDLFEEQKEEKKFKDDDLFKLDLNEDALIVKDEPSTTEILDFEAKKDAFKLDGFEEESLAKVEEEQALVLEEDKDKQEEKVEEVKSEIKEEVLEEVPETKILDKNEIENIKGLLSEDVSDEVSLEELMPTPSVVENENEKKIKKKKAKKAKQFSESESSVVFDSLASLSVEKLRELLAGARVNINIKFPKAK